MKLGSRGRPEQSGSSVRDAKARRKRKMTTELMNKGKKDPTYLMGRGEAETRRLISQSKLYGRFTRRLLEDAGVEKGMKVLDIGTGAGDLALMAAEMVGPTGSVVGVDQDPQVLKVASARAEAACL